LTSGQIGRIFVFGFVRLSTLSMQTPAPLASPFRPVFFIRFSLREGLRLALGFAVTRLGLLIIGLLANAYFPGLYGPQWERLPDKPMLDMWLRWDAGFYTSIATYGFNFAVNQTAASDIAFMPLYPAVVRFVNPVIGCADQRCTVNSILPCTGRECAIISGVLVSNVALLASIFLLYDLIREQLDAKKAMLSAWLLMLAPNSIFFSGVYTESLFLLLALITFQALSRHYFAVAVIAAGLASLTREVGLALYPALIVYAWNQTGRARVIQLLAAQIAPLFFFAYVFGAGAYVGNGMAYFNVNSDVWGVSVGKNAFGSFGPYFPPYETKEFISLWGAGPTWFNLAATLIYLLLAIPSFKLNPSFGLFALVAILIPIASGTLISMPRFGAVVFPHYAVAADWADKPWKTISVLAVCVLMAIFYAVRFVTWRWIA